MPTRKCVWGSNLFYYFLVFNTVCLCACVYWYLHVSTNAYRGQRHWIPLELELQTAVRCPTSAES